MTIRRLLLFLIFALLASCGILPPQNPVVDEIHVVQNAHDASKTITIANGMVWYNIQRTKGSAFQARTSSKPRTQITGISDPLRRWNSEYSMVSEFRMSGACLVDSCSPKQPSVWYRRPGMLTERVQRRLWSGSLAANFMA
jgi:hypothetical protein